MAVPHVTGAAAFANAVLGLSGARLRDALMGAVDRVPALAGRTVTGGRLNVARLLSSSGPTGSSAEMCCSRRMRASCPAAGW